MAGRKKSIKETPKELAKEAVKEMADELAQKGAKEPVDNAEEPVDNAEEPVKEINAKELVKETNAKELVKETNAKELVKETAKEIAASANVSTDKTSKRVQPELNIALVGHVDHGKTTLTERLSGKWTDTHSEELKRGITIRLGYADFSTYKCSSCNVYTSKEKCLKCNQPTAFQRKISLVDAPGHESLMATMLSGAAIVDGALLLIAANEKCPQPQTKEHLMALHISGIKNVIIVQNKIDLVTHEEALENYRQIKEFLSETEYTNAPIIPLSARANVNIDIIIKAIEEFIPTPARNVNADPIMQVARSFDINKPGIKPEKLIGGVLGGTVKEGKFNVGEEIEICPGFMIEEKNKKIWKPLKTKIIQIFSGGKPVDEILPGGSMAISTTLDPTIVKSDSLTGAIVGRPGKLPSIYYQIALDTHLLDRVVGTKDEIEVKPLAKNEVLMLNCNSAATVGVVIDPSKKNTTCALKKPICANKGDRITISRRVGDRFRLIGYGILK